MGNAMNYTFDFEDGDKTPAPDFDVQTGHRERLRRRFLERGADALDDYELLELYLFRTFKRKDTKPVARLLMEKFGSFSSVCAAKFSTLTNISGVGDAVAFDLKLVKALAYRFAEDEFRQQYMVSGWDQLIRYCRTKMTHQDVEHFRVLYLNSKNFLLSDQLCQVGTINHVAVYPREVVRSAFDVNANAVIMIHNHPSGDPTPSQADITMTSQIAEVLKLLSIELHDHIIVGQNGETSLKAEGYI